MADKKKPTENSNSFTIDVDISAVEEMPSITRLLNRKSLTKKPVKTKTKTVTADIARRPPPPQEAPSITEAPPFSFEPQLSDPPSIIDTPSELEPPTDSQLEMPAPPPPDPPQPQGAKEISITLDSSTPPALELQIQHPGEPDPPPDLGGKNTGVTVQVDESSKRSGPIEKAAPPVGTATQVPQPKIQRSARKTSHPGIDLIIWELDQLKSGRDPLGQGIFKMLQKGAASALFLSILPPPPGEPVPHFASTAAVLGQEKLKIWKGLKWNPTIVPEMWNYFIRSGQVELSPPGTLTNQNSNRNVVRAAFGITQKEWLLLVRAGPSTACRGVVAFVSEKSLLSAIQEALPLIAAPSPPSSK